MMSWEVIDWFGCYRRGWGKELVPEAYQHPAKVSYGLSERIYDFLFERGLLIAGMKVVDPFGGICGFGYHAMKHGLNFIAVELEEKFCRLGEQNIALWNSRYAGRFRTWGSARIMQGDSRRLVQMLAEADVSVTSPPFADNNVNIGAVGDTPAMRQQIHDSTKRNESYGSTPGNLGNLAAREGDLDAALTSPPFGEEVHGGMPKSLLTHTDGRTASRKLRGLSTGEGEYSDKDNLGNLQMDGFDAALTSPPFLQTSGGTNVTSDSGPLSDTSLIARHAAGNAAAEAYGESVSNLGNMAEGSLDMAVSSPPFANTGAVLNVEGHARQVTADRAERLADKVYGDNPAQLGNMREGDIDSMLTSPPYTQTLNPESTDPIKRREREERYRASHPEIDRPDFRDYGEANGQLANLREGDVDSVLSSPSYADGGIHQGGNDTHSERADGMGLSQTQKYGLSPGQLAALPEGAVEAALTSEEPDTFWAASRQILAQTYALLRPHVLGQPGGIAVFVLKRYVRDGQIVEFSDNWRRLAESVGFRTLYWIRAWLTTDDGTQLAMDGNHKRYAKKRTSFFRRLHEKKRPDLAIDYEDVIVMCKPTAGA